MNRADGSEALPYLTRDLPGIGGRIKEAPEDFCVEEVPLYMPSGVGTHLYFRVEKRGVPTLAVVERIARYMGVRPSDIGVAGLKDARSVSVQTMSLEHADPDRLATYHDAQARVLSVDRHTNKLRPGHLSGNRFVIRLRGAKPDATATAGPILAVIQGRGVPNYFGPQRFGARRDTGKLGRALVLGDLEDFVRLLLGAPAPTDPPDCRAARDAFEAAQFNRALQLWPRHYGNERRALAAYKRRRDPRAALRAADKRMKRLYVSAFQSEIFNHVLAQRVESIDRVFVGDLAQKTDTGGVFLVADAGCEQGRVRAFEISPTGPIIGYRARLAEEEPGRVEHQVLNRFGVTPQHFRGLGALKAKGSRRALRFRLEQASLREGQDRRGRYVEIAFIAPSGCYATVALREIMKPSQEGQNAGGL